MTIDKIRKGNISRRRNPLIADLLRRIQMVETWGRGMRLILSEEPTVQFSEVARIFIAAFNRSSYAESDKAIDKDLSVSEKAIIRLITANPSMTQKEMAGQLKLTEIGVRYHIKKLKAEGIIQRKGGKKAGRWKVKS